MQMNKECIMIIWVKMKKLTGEHKKLPNSFKIKHHAKIWVKKQDGEKIKQKTLQKKWLFFFKLIFENISIFSILHENCKFYPKI